MATIGLDVPALDSATLASEILRLSALAQDASIDMQGWRPFLEACTHAFGARAAVLLLRFVPPVRPVAEDRYFGISPAYAMDYAERAFAQDAILAEASRRPPGSTFRLEDICPSAAERAAAPVVREWLWPQGLDDVLGLVVNPGQPFSAMLLLLTHARQAPFVPDAETLLRALYPHLARAATVHRQLERARSLTILAEEVLDRTSAGVLCVGRSRRVLLANAAARALLAARDGLHLDDGRLEIDDRQAAPAVQAAIDAAMGREAVIDSADVAPCEACAILPRPSGRAALTVLTTPLLTCDKLSNDERGLALVFLHDPEETPALRASDLAAMFGLTPAQATLAVLLAQGLSLEDIAVRLGLTLNTVRTRVKQVFERTQTSRQVELVRRLVLSAATFRRR